MLILKKNDPKLLTAAPGGIAQAREVASVAMVAGIDAEKIEMAIHSEANSHFNEAFKIMQDLNLKMQAAPHS